MRLGEFFRGSLEEIAYRDTWGRGADSFIAMLYERLVLMRDLLVDDGLLYLHSDWRVNAYIRLALDEVFGKDHFVNEIIWHYYNKMQGNIGRFASNHDIILSYRKGPSFEFTTVREKREKPKKQQARVWDPLTKSLKQAKDDKGQLVYYDDTERTIDDVWKLAYLMPADKREKLGYPTQKPERLIERIIASSSRSDDLVADFFGGAGTVAATAERMGRKWISSDLGKFATHTTRKRLIGVQRALKASGKNYRAFEILNLGKYERQHYVGVNPNLREAEQQAQLAQKEADFLGLILRAYRSEKTDGFKTFQGKKAGRLVSVGPVNLPVTRLYVEEVIAECRQKHITRVDILGFEFEMGLFPHIQEEAKSKGIDLVLKYIPAEVFDKRAVEKNQVRFYDVSFIEVKPHVTKNSIAVELTDFSVFYSQDSIAEAEQSVKERGSKIVVEKGQIVKIAKDKNGVVTRETLTKKWSDWIDYWAVDFDYESKREIIRKPIAPEDLSPAAESYEEVWTGDYIFENEWQEFRTKKDRSLKLLSVTRECPPGRRKIAVKVVDIFGNDTMTIIDVTVGGKR